jgi:hypothetical protein
MSRDHGIDGTLGHIAASSCRRFREIRRAWLVLWPASDMKLDFAFRYVAVLALQLVACSSVTTTPPGGEGAAGGEGGTGGEGASGAADASGGEQASGGSGGSLDECGPGALDCHCPGGYFECQNDALACVCPPECASSDQCADGSICFFYDGYCGGTTPGYCQSLADADEWQCDDEAPSCGCDGNLYDSYCAAVAAGVSPNAAPTSDCTSEPLPCGEGVACYPSDYCMLWNDGSSVSASCDAFDGGCAQPSCDCISYNEAACDCELLPSGLITLTCLI